MFPYLASEFIILCSYFLNYYHYDNSYHIIYHVIFRIFFCLFKKISYLDC
jgi:hypothetical protein